MATFPPSVDRRAEISLHLAISGLVNWEFRTPFTHGLDVGTITGIMRMYDLNWQNTWTTRLCDPMF